MYVLITMIYQNCILLNNIYNALQIIKINNKYCCIEMTWWKWTCRCAVYNITILLCCAYTVMKSATYT